MRQTDEQTLYDQLEGAILCGQAGVLVRSYDYEDVLATMFRLSKEYDDTWQIAIWDRIRGLKSTEDEADSKPKTGLERHTPKAALAAVEAVRTIAEKRWQKWKVAGEDESKVPAEDKNEMIMVLYNGHREIDNGSGGCTVERDLITSLQLTLAIAKGYNCHIVVLAPLGYELPAELKELFWVFDHELPNYEEREDIITDTIQRSGFETPEPHKLESLIKVCGGLTRQQVEGVCARSLARYEEVRESFVWKLKAGMINKSGILTLHKGDEKFDSYMKKVKNREVLVPGIGGLAGVKDFCLRLLKDTDDPDVIAQPKGILLLGVPGTGKSAFCKALGNMTGRPTLTLDIGRLMGGLVGQTEERTREALRIADAMAPCILFVDEIEKALGGAGGEHDGGVNSRLKGTLLGWLNDHESDVFFVATANDISMLPPEMTRSERFDATFFMDLPHRKQKELIWDIYTRVYHIKSDTERPNDAIWTGAEIKSCCKLANRLRVPLVDAAHYVIPVFKTWRDKISALRDWASSRCVNAETGREYVAKSQSANDSGDGPAVTERSRQKITRRTKSS